MIPLLPQRVCCISVSPVLAWDLDLTGCSIGLRALPLLPEQFPVCTETPASSGVLWFFHYGCGFGGFRGQRKGPWIPPQL